MFKFFFFFLQQTSNSLYHNVDIEEESCQTTYVQWVETHSTNGTAAITMSNSLLPSMFNQDFECQEGQPGKFR